MEPTGDLERALADAGGAAAPREWTARLRELLLSELERGAGELAEPRTGREHPIALAVGPVDSMVASVLPLPPALRADCAAAAARAASRLGGRERARRAAGGGGGPGPRRGHRPRPAQRRRRPRPARRRPRRLSGARLPGRRPALVGRLRARGPGRL